MRLVPGDVRLSFLIYAIVLVVDRNTQHTRAPLFLDQSIIRAHLVLQQSLSATSFIKFEDSSFRTSTALENAVGLSVEPQQ